MQHVSISTPQTRRWADSMNRGLCKPCHCVRAPIGMSAIDVTDQLSIRSAAETQLAVACINLPSLGPLLKRFRRRSTNETYSLSLQCMASGPSSMRNTPASKDPTIYPLPRSGSRQTKGTESIDARLEKPCRAYSHRTYSRPEERTTSQAPPSSYHADSVKN